MLKAEEKTTDPFKYPAATNPESVEWAGTPIGKSNTITRTKSRTTVYDKTIDEKPGRREELMNAVTTFLASPEGKKSEISTHDVVIHGIRVRAMTNSKHLTEFWQDNWYSVSEWKKMTGQEVQATPQVWVYALGGVNGQAEAAYYSRLTNTIIFFNTSYYGQLKSWVLGAAGRVLADDFGIHSIHGAVVEKNKVGVLYIAPTGTGKSTSSYGMMEFPGTRFHSDDWVYIRYALTTKDGKKVCPNRITPKQGPEVKGFRCFQWLEEHQTEDVEVKALTIENTPVMTKPSQIDFSKPVEAYAYVSEKVFYLRCNLVESFPQSAYSILQANLENVPDVTPEFMKEHEVLLESNLKAIRGTDHKQTKEYFAKLSDDQVKTILARLFAFDNARAMLDITKVFEPNQIFVNPIEPVKLNSVMLLKRNFKEDQVIETLNQDRFMERLLIGETPQGKREVAYNGYRAVDEATEFKFIGQIEKESAETKEPLYHVYLSEEVIPPSLIEEFELFRLMHRSCACYDLNTILQKDTSIPDRKTAVVTTMKVIAKAMEAKGQELKYDISDYKKFIGA